jgi:hypothetical protein
MTATSATPHIERLDRLLDADLEVSRSSGSWYDSGASNPASTGPVATWPGPMPARP